MRRHRPVIAHCTDSEDFPNSVHLQTQIHRIFRIHGRYVACSKCTENSDSPSKTTVSEGHQIRVRVTVSSRVRVAVRFGSLVALVS